MDPHELAGRRILPIGSSHDVGMASPCQSPVRRLDLLKSGARVDAEGLVQRGARRRRGSHIRRRAAALGGSGREGGRRSQSHTWRGLRGKLYREIWSVENSSRGRDGEHGTVRFGVCRGVRERSALGSQAFFLFINRVSGYINRVSAKKGIIY